MNITDTIAMDNLIPPNKILDELKNLLNNPLLKELTNRKKPQGYSKRSNTPYYKIKFALEAKSILDEMLDKGKDKDIRYDDHREYSRNTIYLRFTQGLAFLLDNLDPDDKYKIFMDFVAVTKERNIGIRLSMHGEHTAKRKSLRATDVLTPEELMSWRHQVEDFLENAPEGAEFTKKGLCLTHSEIEALKSSLSPLTNIGANITSTTVTLRKIPLEYLEDSSLLPE